MKDAVVLILDANDSMAASYDEDRDPTTRFECAKRVCLDLISDLMIRSKTNEAAVLVLKSPITRHHFWEKDMGDDREKHSAAGGEDEKEGNSEIPFPHLLELGGDGQFTGVNRPHPDLLRSVHRLKVTTDSRNLRGDFCDGIVVAADALYKRTSGKKYQRRIVLITDAEHKVMVDSQQLLVVLDSLRAMECRLEVIGMDFEQQAEYETAIQVKQEPGDKVLPMDLDGAKNDKTAENSDDESNDSATEASLISGSDSDDNEEGSDKLMIKRQNEKLLISLTEKTGGFVMAAKELQPILQKMLGQKTPKSTRRKVQFQIAPGLVCEARFSLLLSKASTPSLKKRVAELEPGETADDPDAKVKKNDLGVEITHEIQTLVTHWDPEQDTREMIDIAQAYRYGSDLVPMSGLDMAGLVSMSSVKLTILGYLGENQVPHFLRIGPPYALAGADSQRACAAIAALARAMKAKQLVGIATLVKSKDADPILMALFPLEESNKRFDKRRPPNHLCMMQIPFRGDVTNLTNEGFVLSTEKTNQEAADNLIDSLMLPTDKGDYRKISNPFLRSFHQTVVQRVLDPECGTVSVRDEAAKSREGDPMTTPKSIAEAALPALKAFRKQFPLSKADHASQGGANGGKRRKGPLSYHDFVDR